MADGRWQTWVAWVGGAPSATVPGAGGVTSQFKVADKVGRGAGMDERMSMSATSACMTGLQMYPRSPGAVSFIRGYNIQRLVTEDEM